MNAGVNTQRIAVVVTPPGADGWGSVSQGDQTRQCYFAPARFRTPWPVPSAGDRVLVTLGRNQQLEAVWLLGQGVPA